MLASLLGFVLIVFGAMRDGLPPVQVPPEEVPPIVYEVPAPAVDQSKQFFTPDEAIELMKLAGIPAELHGYFLVLGQCESGWNRLAKGDLYADGYYRSIGLMQTNIHHYFPASQYTPAAIHAMLDNGEVPPELDPYNPVTNLKVSYRLYLSLGTFGTTGGWFNCALKHGLP